MIYYGKQESWTNKKESSAAFKIVETIKECYHGIKYHILLTENVNSKEIMINGDGKVKRYTKLRQAKIQKWNNVKRFD